MSLGRVADHPHRTGVADGEQPHQLGERQVPVLWPQRLHDGGDRRVGLQAPALSAPAQRSAFVDRDVADLARATAPPDEGAVDEQAAPDAVVELEGHAVVAAASRAPGVLAERGQVGVVVDAHRDAERVSDLACRHAVPAGKDARRRDRVWVPADRAGHRHASADERAPAQARRGERLADQLAGGGEGGAASWTTPLIVDGATFA